MQVHGGHGLHRGDRRAQHFRDARIAQIYEGTNGIQAADLVGRKLGMRGGGVVTDLLDEFDGRAKQLADIDDMGAFGERLGEAVAAARTATSHLVAVGRTDPRSQLGASVPYLRLLGTTVCAGLLAKGALAAAQGAGDDAAHRAAKITSARFFGEQILPSVAGLLPAVTAAADDLFALDAAQLS